MAHAKCDAKPICSYSDMRHTDILKTTFKFMLCLRRKIYLCYMQKQSLNKITLSCMIIHKHSRDSLDSNL